ncbi:zinc-ribbon domain-containing protein [Schleiferiaceae bacterium]|nr:zinc-ribbon domain-containing protein [Schleiferiaceae bacterium]
MGFFTRKSINRNKVTLFINCLIAVASSDDDFSEEEQNFIREVVMKIRNHYNYHKDFDEIPQLKLNELQKTIDSLVIEDKQILMSILMEVAEADKVLKFQEIGAMLTVASMIQLDLEALKLFFIDAIKEYKINEKLFDEYYTIFLDKGKDAANQYIEGENIDVDSNIIFCPHCGAENSSDNKFCTSCGKKLDA